MPASCIKKLALMGALASSGCVTQPVARETVVIHDVPPASVVVYEDTGMPVVVTPPKEQSRFLFDREIVVRPIYLWPRPPRPLWHPVPHHPPHPLLPPPHHGHPHGR